MAAAGYFGLNYYNASVKVAETPKTAGEAVTDVQALINEISQHIVLPDETPEVATISDVTKLGGKDFFKNAQNGDAVLIFKESGRGLIYRPSTHKIIEYTKVEFQGTLQE